MRWGRKRSGVVGELPPMRSKSSETLYACLEKSSVGFGRVESSQADGLAAGRRRQLAQKRYLARRQPRRHHRMVFST